MNTIDKAIGVFDSGLGGVSVLKDLKKIMPNEDFIYFGDSLYAPYGTKSRKEIMTRCMHICDFFLMQGVKAIVIACNTATSACVNELRETYAMIPIIGMEPALKLATQQEGQQKILVMATEFTLKEEKFANLMERFKKEHTIYRQPCPKLVKLVEGHLLQNESMVVETLKEYLYPYDLKTLNSIVLGCTHFVFYREAMKHLLPKHIKIIDGNIGTANHLMHMLEERDERKKTKNIGMVHIYNSMKDEAMIVLSKELLYCGNVVEGIE